MTHAALRRLLASSLTALLGAGLAVSDGRAQIGGKITELGSGGRSFNDDTPDVALDPTNNVYAHVFETGSKAPRQIRFKLFEANTGRGVAGGDVALSSGNSDNRRPRVAYIAKSSLFLVTWQSNTNGNN